jgi:archaeal type IV pilus assembly protein PilA
MKNRKGISPVIATVILVAVAITVAIAVSYWMSGITSSYTKFEKVEIQTATCAIVGNDWDITVSLKNSGTATSTMTNVFLNDVEVVAAASASGYDAVGATDGYATTSLTKLTAWTLASGEAKTFHVYIGNGYASLSSGTTVNLKIHSAGGMDYIKLVELV